MKHTNDSAVSPVIGVILMVAITVILSAVIAAFVFGYAGTIQHTRIVGATLSQQTADKIAVTYVGGQDAKSLISLNVTIDDQEGIINAPVDAQGALKVGTTKMFTGNFTGTNHVIVVGNFQDGSQQMILESYL